MIFATFIIRHIIAVVLCVIAACVGWTLLYVFLLVLSAISSDDDPGSLVAYPFGLACVGAVVLAVGSFIFAPACGAGLIFSSYFKLPRLTAIPVVFGAGAVMSYAVYYAMMKSGGHPTPDVMTVLWNYTIYLSLPLGIYWWLVEGPWAIVDLVRRMIRQRKLARQEATGLEP